MFIQPVSSTSNIAVTKSYKDKSKNDFAKKFKVGTKVIIINLKNKPKLNNTQAVVILDSNTNKSVIKTDTIRICIETHANEKLAIKPSNLLIDFAQFSSFELPPGIQQSYDPNDGSPIFNCLDQQVGMHDSTKSPPWTLFLDPHINYINSGISRS